MDADVIVIGAGLAGLQATRRLQDGGLDVLVVDGADGIGGRIRTDVVDGFRCDRGFQLLNQAYPMARQALDMHALRVQSFGAGVLVRRDDEGSGLVLVADPRRAPTRAIATARSGLVHPGEAARFAAWLAPVLARPESVKDAGTDRSLRESLDEAGLTGDLRRRVVDTFLAGVVAEAEGDTSASVVKLLLRSFLLGRVGLPHEGMGAIPAQLAGHLRRPVRLQTPVERVQDWGRGVSVQAVGGTLQARGVVVAVSPEDAHRFAGVDPVPTKGLVTWWFAVESDELAGHTLTGLGPYLALDGRRRQGGPSGPVWNTAAISVAAPSYAPPGQTLVEATTLLTRPDGQAPEEAVRRHVGEIYGVSTARWRTVVRHEITHALPVHPPRQPLRQDQRLGDRTWVIGDHRDTPSIQGALTSGDRVAADVLATLGGGER